MRDDHKSTKTDSTNSTKAADIFTLSLCALCALLWLKLKLETDFRRNVFVPKVPRILTSVA